MISVVVEGLLSSNVRLCFTHTKKLLTRMKGKLATYAALIPSSSSLKESSLVSKRSMREERERDMKDYTAHSSQTPTT